MMIILLQYSVLFSSNLDKILSCDRVTDIVTEMCKGDCSSFTMTGYDDHFAIRRVDYVILFYGILVRRQRLCFTHAILRVILRDNRHARMRRIKRERARNDVRYNIIRTAAIN